MKISITKTLQKGVEAHRRGQFLDADKLYTDILEVEPKHPDANHNKGLLAARVGNHKMAVKFFKVALNADLTVPQFWLSLHDSLINLNKIDEAKTLFLKAKRKNIDGNILNRMLQQFNTAKIKRNKIEKDKDPGQDQLKILESLFIEGNTKKAIAKVKKLLLFYPNSSLLFNIQGLLSSGLKNFDSALENYDKAIEKNPNFVEPYFNKGNAMRDNGNLNSALQCYKKAIKIKPDYAEVYNNMGNVFADLGDFSSAVKSYREAIKIKPEYADTHYNLAVSLNDIGETTAALKSYNNALKINPELINAIYNKGNIYKKIGNAQFALDCYKKVLKLNPNHQQAAHLLASLIGETTKSAPTVYVEKLFDGYAPQFEHSLVGELEYKVPKKLTKIILDNHLTGTLGSVLDLGCGTGLMGLEIKKFCNFLEGLDISNAMLEQARQKNVYNKLSHREILDFLSLETLNFDYFIFADVFTYVGDLSDLFKLIKTRNKFGGKLAFSTEDNEEVGFFLEKTGRYSHSYKYIESLCKKFNYRILYFESINLRKQNNSFLTGKLYLLDF